MSVTAAGFTCVYYSLVLETHTDTDTDRNMLHTHTHMLHTHAMYCYATSHIAGAKNVHSQIIVLKINS